MRDWPVEVMRYMTCGLEFCFFGIKNHPLLFVEVAISGRVG